MNEQNTLQDAENIFDDLSSAKRKIVSMKTFADGCESFNYGEWKEWDARCLESGQMISPAYFKALPADEKRRTSNPPFSAKL